MERLPVAAAHADQHPDHDPAGRAVEVSSAFGIQYAEIMASAVLGALPLIVVFLLFQRRIVEGIATTGIK